MDHPNQCYCLSDMVRVAGLDSLYTSVCKSKTEVSPEPNKKLYIELLKY